MFNSERTMPRSIKPRMSRDELSGFDSDILSVEYTDGELDLHIAAKVYPEDEVHVIFNEQELEQLIQFIRRNKN